MPTSKNRINISLDKKLVERFRKLYPNILNIYVNRAIELGLQDKSIFEEVFFNPIFMEVL